MRAKLASASWPPWPNGQGVGLLIRRLRVRVPQGVLFLGSSMHKPRSNHRMPWRLFCSMGVCHTQQAKPSGCKNAPLEARIPILGVSPRLQRNGLRKRLLAKKRRCQTTYNKIGISKTRGEISRHIIAAPSHTSSGGSIPTHTKSTNVQTKISTARWTHGAVTSNLFRM